MKLQFLFRILLSGSPKRAYDTIRSTGEVEWKRAYDAAKRSEANGKASDVETGYVAFIDTYRESLEGNARVEHMISGWAAFCLPVRLFEHYLNLTARDQNAGAIIANISARKAAAAVRTFPPEPKTKKPAPNLETVEAKALRSEWENSAPILTAMRETPESAAEKIAEMTADDLHEIATNLTDLMDAPMVLAVARHPKLDRGTALELLYSFSASAYQSYWRKGRSEDSFDTCDTMLFDAFAAIAERAESDGFASSRFSNRFHKELAHLESWDVDTDDDHHPCNWVKWRLPKDALAPVLAEKHQPAVHGDHGVIRQSFDVWKAAQTR